VIIKKGRFIVTPRLRVTTQIQLNPEHEGPEVEAQEREKGSFKLDGSIRQSLWNDQVRLTLQARDIIFADLLFFFNEAAL